MNFATLKSLEIPEGVVTKIEDASGRVLWKHAPAEATVTITELTGVFYTPQQQLWLEIDGTTYKEVYSPIEITVPIGAVIKCCYNSASTYNKIYLNETVIAEGMASYDYTVMGNISIEGIIAGTVVGGSPNVSERCFKITEL